MAAGESTLKYKVSGMDCAACVAKIETAVKRIDGVSAVKVGLQSETLTVGLVTPATSADVEKAVRGFGYDLSPAGAAGSRATATPAGHRHHRNRR